MEAQKPFDGRLNLTSNGDLTINNVTAKDDGVFVCTSRLSDYTIHSQNILDLSVESKYFILFY